MANAQLRLGGEAHDVSEIVYPGADLRAIPPFTCSCPPGWTAAEAPGAIAVVRPPAPASSNATTAGAPPELRIESVRVPAGTRLADLARANLARRRRTAPDLAIVTQKLGTFGATPAHLCGVAWTAPEGGRTAQLQVVVLAPVEPGRAVVDALIITGTCAEADAPALVPEYVRVASSIRFGASIGSGSSDGAGTSGGAGTSEAPRDIDPFTTAAS